ncbi:FGGY family carbohydrate kinase [Phytoactinopolyspora mesophila]|uniref:Carbohydrate kinase n=1 Tax=Phytoactinopolyspora mesophila TaxID=2650750 RepID=A0A7K3M2Y3_9ACTN|nr:carbohydrate kinase [Phytoactinopolyspora mesophila]
MTQKHAYLGLDIGTSGVKVTLISADGRLIASGEEPYSISAPQPDHAETDPATWIAGVSAALHPMAEALSDVDVAALGIAGQMHGAVLCDQHGNALAPAILWPDRRAVDELERWRALRPEHLATLANPLAPGMTGPILAWLGTHHPDVVAQASVVLGAKDAVRAAVVDRPATATPVTDRSDASATLLWDVPGERWATEVCTAVGVPTRLLPEVAPSSAIVGETSLLRRIVGDASSAVPVVTGAADTAAAALAVEADGLQVNFGTGAQVILPTGSAARSDAHPSTHLYANTDDAWYAMAALQNGGLALEWAAAVLGLTWNAMINAAAEGPAGGVSFLPFLSGERGGVASPSSHGGWLGLGTTTTRTEMARAAVRGVVFAIRRGIELLGDLASDDGRAVTLTGGGWRAPELCQLAADVLQRPARRVDVRSASATGAAKLAARGVGVDLHPARAAAALVGPRYSPELAGDYERWRERCSAGEL